ncbi:MAG: TlpA disulfide reductase family protein [Candidatus Bathyarchaeia archaeon]
MHRSFQANYAVLQHLVGSRQEKGCAWAALVVVAILAVVIGVIWLPSRAGLQQSVTTSIQQSVSTTSIQQCPPCQHAVPVMEAMYKEYSGQGVVFIAEVPWQPDLSHYQNVTITQFLNKYSSSLTCVYDSTGTFTSLYNVDQVPKVFVLSKHGTVHASYTGSGGVSSLDSGVSIDEALGNLPLAPVSYGQWADPVGDTSSGQPGAVADKYIDITQVSVGKRGPTYIFNISMAGPLPPASSASSSTFVEWDVLLDLDRNNATHPCGSYPSDDNGIGVDAIARLTWWGDNSGYSGELMTWPNGTQTFQTIGFKVNGTVATIYLEPSMIHNPNSFDFVYRVAKFAEPGDKFIVEDKTPNHGHFTYANESIIAPANGVAVTWYEVELPVKFALTIPTKFEPSSVV